MPESARVETRELSGGKFVHLVRPYGVRLLLVVILLGLLAGTNMALPYAVKLLIDDVFPGAKAATGNWTLLWAILPALASIYVVRNTLFFSSRMVSLRLSEDLCFSVRKRLFEHLQQMSLRFYKSHQAGKVSSRIMDDTFKIQSFIQDKLPTLLLNVMTSQILIVIIYVVNWRLAVATTVILPLHFMTYRLFRVPIRRSHREAQEKLSTAYGNLIEKYLGMEVVKGFSAEERESERFNEAIDASRRSQIRSQRFHFAQKVVADLLVGLGTVLLFGYGALEVMNGRMTGGTFFMYFGYVTMLYPSVLEIIGGFAHLSRATASVDRVFEMMDVPVREPIRLGRGATQIEPLQGEIELRNVSFGYDDGCEVLRDINIRIRPGEHVAVTGPSGSGKSTMIGLLPRFIDATRGQVLIDDHDVLEIPVRSLRSGIAIAFQEVFLFSTSIYENLRYAQPDATLEQVVQACRLTGAHEFIERLPDGYNTRLGEFGGELSRGEKQRITLARALLKDPRILIMDEATASIDSRSARLIVQAIFKRMEGRTIVMVTHDTELLEVSDRVICVREGAIVFDGSPEDYAALDKIPVSPREVDDHPRPTERDRPLPSAAEGSRPPDDGAGDSQDEDPCQPQIKPGTGQFPRGLVGLFVAMSFTIIGCVSTRETVKSIEMVEPRASSGLLIADPDPEALAQLEAVFAEIESRDAVEAAQRLDWEFAAGTPAGAPGSPQDPPAPATKVSPEQPHADETDIVKDAPPDLTIAQQIAAAEKLNQYPPNAGQLIRLPKLGNTEINELIDNLVLKFVTEMGYAEAGSALAQFLPPVPEGIAGPTLIARSSADGLYLLQLGCHQSLSQAPQLWVYGLFVREGQNDVNPDMAAIGPAVDPILASIAQMKSQLLARDLERKLIKLSYVDAARAMIVLKSLGVNTATDIGDPTVPTDFDRLPLVIQMPALTKEEIALVGTGGVGRGSLGETSMPSVASQIHPDVIGIPANELLVLFHPAHPEQFSRVKRTLDEIIDRPARQIFVEGMVLEISEDGLDELGIEWAFKEGPIDWILGSLQAGGIMDTLDFSRVDSRDVRRDWSVRIRALVRDGKAEILSRPSVLTLDNRQASIRVGEDIPIATAQSGTLGGDKLSFSFKYLPVGILLNVRPRVTADGKQVTMLIDTIVSATVPGKDLELRSTNSQGISTVLARAPTVSNRRVQTHARIDNNTPFIIGGLVSRDRTIVQDKVPFLGDIPFLGGLFRSERIEETKREVIIVITPHVLPEDHHVARSLPKDEDLFDSAGNILFRDAIRIRTEDVFDLAFLLENRRLAVYRNLAQRVIRDNFRLAEVDPFRQFVGDRVPGEHILVHRMIYEVIKRVGTDRLVDPLRIIFFEGQQVGGYDVKFLDQKLSELGGGRDASSFFKNNSGKALAITFHYDRESLRSGRLASEPVPSVTLIDCPDRKAWGQLLWELNQPTGDGRQRFTVLLRDAQDMVRLKRAIVLKRIVHLNGGPPETSLQNFTVGKVLLMPEIKEDQHHVLDADVARFFYHTEHYYAATINMLESALQELDRVLRLPEMQHYLQGIELPPIVERRDE